MTAPFAVDVVVTDGPPQIRIGSQWATVDGLHRYVIQYRVTGAAIARAGARVSSIGEVTGWTAR